jgi:uncharacterized protein YqeY
VSLQTRLADDLKTSMKARDKEATSTLRMLLAALKNEAVEKGRGPQGEMSDEEVQQVLAREKKKRDEAAASYAENGRDESAAKEQAESELIAGYLPEQMSDEELDAEVQAAIDEVGATSMADMGRTMKVVMARVGNQAEGSRVSAAVKAKLQG